MRGATGWILVLCVAGCSPTADWNGSSSALAADSATDNATPIRSSTTFLEVAGTTVPAPGRVSEIAATVMHPVTRVFVKPGDRVKAGDPLVELDSDEPQAEVRARAAVVQELTAKVARLKSMPRDAERAEARAQLESAQIAHRAARAYLERLAELRQHDAVSARQYIEQQTVVHRAEADERAAQAHLDYLLRLPIEHEIAEAESAMFAAEAELDAAEHELEHYTVYASIAGVICWLDVTPGTVNRAGSKVWGEIVDLTEIDVRVELTPRQLRQIDWSQPVQISQPELDATWQARFVYAAPAANKSTGRIPVVLRVTEQGAEPLRCHVNVTARFVLSASGENHGPVHQGRQFDDTVAGN